MNLKLDLKGKARATNIFEWNNFVIQEIFLLPAVLSSRNINLEYYFFILKNYMKNSTQCSSIRAKEIDYKEIMYFTHIEKGANTFFSLL